MRKSDTRDTTPAHRSGGLYRLLESARVYELLQNLLGADAAQRRLVAEVVRPEAGARLLDIGCGAGDFFTYLPAGVSYAGYDLNPRYIETARERFGNRAEFHCARAGAPPEELLDGRFDKVLAKAVLHHLDDREAEALMRVAQCALRPGGILVTLDPVFHPGQALVSRWLIALDRGRQVRTPEGYVELLAGRFEPLESRVLTDLSRVPYSHFVLRARRV
ncbi:MAG TPA: class I SAM-dependent methyltransferase [Thermoanaerobaculia bacterium]|nr:class I SAM-dependent methyltransferase [Thermoanaerobaculia bacterium]